jgi:hypothetical protein
VAVVRRAEYVAQCLLEGKAIKPPPEPLLMGPGQEPTQVVRYNKGVGDVMRALLQREDWRACTDEELQGFLLLLRESF